MIPIFVGDGWSCQSTSVRTLTPSSENWGLICRRNRCSVGRGWGWWQWWQWWQVCLFRKHLKCCKTLIKQVQKVGKENCRNKQIKERSIGPLGPVPEYVSFVEEIPWITSQPRQGGASSSKKNSSSVSCVADFHPTQSFELQERKRKRRHGIPWNPMESPGVPCSPMESHGLMPLSSNGKLDYLKAERLRDLSKRDVCIYI